MSIFDDLRKLAHPDEPEDGDEDYAEAFPDLQKRDSSFSSRDRRVSEEDRQNKVVNIRTTTNLKVVVMRPERFTDAGGIGDQLKAKRTVVLNMEKLNENVQRRIMDFLSGVAYASEGKVTKVAERTYIITPFHVDVLGEALIDELESNGLYL